MGLRANLPAMIGMPGEAQDHSNQTFIPFIAKLFLVDDHVFL